jgi:hypothetical protein
MLLKFVLRRLDFPLCFIYTDRGVDSALVRPQEKKSLSSWRRIVKGVRNAGVRRMAVSDQPKPRLKSLTDNAHSMPQQDPIGNARLAEFDLAAELGLALLVCSFYLCFDLSAFDRLYQSFVIAFRLITIRFSPLRQSLIQNCGIPAISSDARRIARSCVGTRQQRTARPRVEVEGRTRKPLDWD